MHALRRDERASEGTEVVLVLLQGHDVNVSHPAEDGKNLLAAAAPHPQEDGACRLEPQKLAHPRNRHRRSANRILHDRSIARRLLERHAVAALFLLLGRLLQMDVLLFRPRHVIRAAEGGESRRRFLVALAKVRTSNGVNDDVKVQFPYLPFKFGDKPGLTSHKLLSLRSGQHDTKL